MRRCLGMKGNGACLMWGGLYCSGGVRMVGSSHATPSEWMVVFLAGFSRMVVVASQIEDLIVQHKRDL
ncbi:hypothetical protein FRX31_024569 [Thalictrum thalictroides]|uniref:Uncharacterized protein n=1 Tax=Thalictrum thalictroides TaxID=46969 RepID=A0A7J6VL42_THATH|nr:hypothetical protein FRX31_024569 [Thalictrum thalictroides]